MNIEEYPYFEYPKGLDLHSEYVITPIEDFKNYMRKYGMTRDEAIYWKNYNEDDKLFEKKQIMKCDADTYFTFTVATGQDMHSRIIFIHNIASMVANAVVGGVLYRLVKEDPDKNTHIRSSLKSYIDCVKEMYDMEWLPSVAHAIRENL